jgi:hypothetical protein
MLRIILSIIAVYGFIYTANAQTEQNIQKDIEFEKEIAKLSKIMFQGEVLSLNEEFEMKLVKYILINEKIHPKEYGRQGKLYIASMVFINHIYAKYGATEQSYASKIKDKELKKAYQFSHRNIKRLGRKMRGLYICANGDETEAKRLEKQIDKEWKRLQKLDLMKNPKNRKTKEYSDIILDINEICKYTDYRISLLRIYKTQKKWQEYAGLMVELIKDDQIKYNYIYTDIGERDAFFEEYLSFLQGVSMKYDEYNKLSKDDIRVFTESILYKHKELFDLSNEYYFDPSEARLFRAEKAFEAVLERLVLHEFSDLIGPFARFVLKQDRLKGRGVYNKASEILEQ